MPIHEIESSGERITRDDLIERIDPEVMGRLKEHYGAQLGRMATFHLYSFERSTPDSVDADITRYDELREEFRKDLRRAEECRARGIRHALDPNIFIQ